MIPFCRKYPDRYEEAAVIEGPLPKTIFRVRQPAGTLFARNGGKIKASINRIEIELDDPRADAVIRYNYSPELSVPSPAVIFPVEIQGATFIGIRPNGESNVTIRFRSWP